MFVIELSYKKPLEIVDQYLVEHREYLQQCYQQNYLIVSGPQNPRVGGILISQITDRNLLENILQNDPFYIQGIAEYKIIEFSPVKYHPDFASFISN